MGIRCRMIVRLRSAEFINLAHAVVGDRTPDGGMRIFVRDAQPRNLPPDDADRVRRHLLHLDPEPLLGETPLPADPRDASAESVIRDMPPPAPAPRRRRGGPPGAS